MYISAGLMLVILINTVVALFRARISNGDAQANDRTFMTTHGRQTKTYPTSDAMQRGVEAMTRQGWRVESTIAGQSASGWRRWIDPETAVAKLLRRSPPGYTVTYFTEM